MGEIIDRVMARVDAFDWSVFDVHIYSHTSGHDIPAAFRQLIDYVPSEDDDDLDNEGSYALFTLFGEGQDSGTAYPASPSIINFIMQMLPDPDLRMRPEIVWYITAILINRRQSSQPWATTLLLTDCYRTVILHFLIISRLLDDPTATLRSTVVDLVAELHTESPRLLPILDARLNAESIPNIKQQIALAIGKLIKNTSYLYTDQCRIHLEALLKNFHGATDEAVRLSLAIALYTANEHSILRIRSLLDEVKTYLFKRAAELTRFSLQEVLDCLIVQHVEDFFELARTPTLDPESAHSIIHAMLCSFFRLSQDTSYHKVQPAWLLNNRFEYRAFKAPLIDNGKPDRYYFPMLHVIADCDPFWEIRTNLLSFYLQLPDDRDAFRMKIRELEASP